MTEKKLNSLYKERSRLLEAWRTANSSNKMSILIRIGDIDEQIEILRENLAGLSTKKLNPEY